MAKQSTSAEKIRERHIQDVRRDVGWAYPQLRWLTADQATQAMHDRQELLGALSGRVDESYWQNKLHQGPLSPGCVTCGEGTWSCIYINGLCTAHCFYCQQDRSITEERPPRADGIVFRSPKDYADFVQKVGFRGVGFSGGEPLLVYDQLLAYLGELRKTLGDAIYLWIYTNGDLVNGDKLAGLRDAGLDEIRFDASARNYDLRPVERAAGVINTVTVEIPAIPEDFETVKAALRAMQSLGVRHLNLHQLLTSKYNYGVLIRRPYTFLHHPAVSVLESEMTALRLLLYAVGKGIALPINYCSAAYKYRLQGRGRRRRAARLACSGFEDTTDSGYIRRLTVQGGPASLEYLARALTATECSDLLWSLNGDRTELAIHPSLLPHVDSAASTGLGRADWSYLLSYYTPELRDPAQQSPAQPGEADDSPTMVYDEIDLSGCTDAEETAQELALDSGRTLHVVRNVAAEYRGLSPAAIESFRKLFVEGMDRREVLAGFFLSYQNAAKEKARDMAREGNVLKDLTKWERVPEGFPEIY